MLKIDVMKGRWSLLLILLVFVSPLCAQTEENKHDVLQIPLFFSEINPENALGILALDLPFNFPGKWQTQSHFSAGYSMANTWHPQARFYYPQSLTPYQKMRVNNLNIVQRPIYFRMMDIDVGKKSFQSDGVLQHFRLAWMKTWKGRNSLVLNMNVHMLNGGRSPINFLASDGFIEAFHSNLAIEDNYGRRLYPFNRAVVEFVDEQGKAFRKEKGDLFTGVFDLHYYRRLFQHVNSRFHFSSQVAAHLSVPLNEYHPYVIPGLSAGFRTDCSVGPSSALSLAFDGGITDQTRWKLGEGIHAIDWRYRKHLKLYMGLHFISKRKNITMIGILNNFQDPLMKGARYNHDKTGYEDIGIRFLGEGDVWEGEPVSQEFYLSKFNPAALYYYSIKTYFMLGFHKKGREFTIYAGEDMLILNNAPDIQYGFQYRMPLGNKK